jgi:hypothetical protein
MKHNETAIPSGVEMLEEGMHRNMQQELFEDFQPSRASAYPIMIQPIKVERLKFNTY